MHISQFEFLERRGEPNEWSIGSFAIGPVTLLVGKNASGKTRTLNAISSLARTLYRGVVPTGGEFRVTFDNGFQYELRVRDAQVTHERLFDSTEILLERATDGKGWLKGADISSLKFGLAESQIGAFVKRDSVQHPFLEVLFDWAQNLRQYRFGEPLGKNSFAVVVDEAKSTVGEKLPKVNPRDPEQVVALFAVAQKKDPSFSEAVAADMNAIGYGIEGIFLEELDRTVFGELSIPVQGMLQGLAVKERGLSCTTPQAAMSQGMFRALSILVHMNYAARSSLASTVVLDDVGEGLDFDRSTSLIGLLISKAQESNTQLIMSTNDRYVMNRVPLSSWAVIVREGSNCRILNYANSRDKFEQFELTGLTNFDFMRMEYWKEGEDGRNA